MRERHIFVIAIAAALCIAPALALTAYAAPSLWNRNLVVDGNFEQSPVNTNASNTVVAPGWTFHDGMTALAYGTSGGYLMPNDPGPPDRGKSYVSGGEDARSTGEQSIDVSSGATRIDAGGVQYEFSAWLGGWGGQSDYATASASFLDASGHTLASASLGGEPAAAWPKSELLAHAAHGTVPKGTRSVHVVITAVREEGSWNDGSIDDVSIVLK